MMKVSLKEEHKVTTDDWSVAVIITDGEPGRLMIRRHEEETAPISERPYTPSLSTCHASRDTLIELRDALSQLIMETENA